MEYLVFLLSNNVLITLLSKVEAINAIDVKTKLRDIHRFVGLVNYFGDMWRK